jgi:hypothetical protein
MRALINEINPDESVPNMRSEQPTCQLHALAKRAQRSFSNYAKQSSTGTALSLLALLYSTREHCYRAGNFVGNHSYKRNEMENTGCSRRLALLAVSTDDSAAASESGREVAVSGYARA